MSRCNRIVVPLDGSATAERAIPFATDLARRLGVPLHLIRVADAIELLDTAPPSTTEEPTTEEPTREISEAEAMAEEYLVTVRGWLGATGLPVTSETRRGNPARQLLSAAGDQDIVVMTTSGRGENPVMGSVAAWVITRAWIPVLLIPSADRSPPAQLARSVETNHSRTLSGDDT